MLLVEETKGKLGDVEIFQEISEDGPLGEVDADNFPRQVEGLFSRRGPG